MLAQPEPMEPLSLVRREIGGTMAEPNIGPAVKAEPGAPAAPEETTEPASVTANEIETDALKLQALTASHDGQQHKLYSDELIDLLTDDDRRAAVWNIALTGNYGSGKSSVLAGVRDQLNKDEKKRRVVQISLSALSDVGVTAANESDDPLAARGLTNYIQKEIVKQLLYQVRPSRVSGSRFRRLSRPSKQGAFFGALLGAVTLVGLLWLTGWGAPLALSTESEWLRPLTLGAIGMLVVALLYFAQLLLANRWRFDKVGTSSASISLTANDKSDTYFDEYLDEIVYFFEKTKRDVVIIEDLDRFEDSSIYASLRELNTLLNAAEQLDARPVHFIYAVRDSIFEDLAEQRAKRNPANIPDQDPEEHHGVWQAEKRLAEPATQRTKFFELVVPIVPFITHRSATDLLSGLMKEVDPKVTLGAIRVVAKHVTDMRLLQNIVNEYRVFKARVLGPNTPKGLSEDNLFAVIAYKNTHLEDFEKIQVSDSNLDHIYRRSRLVISEGLTGLAAELEALESAQAPHSATAERATLLGSTLQSLSERWLRNAGRNPTQVQYWVASGLVANDDVLTVDFWKQVIDDGHPIKVNDSLGEVFSLTAAALREELGDIVPSNWLVSGKRDQSEAIVKTRESQRWLRAADIGDLLQPEVSLPKVKEEEYDAWVRVTVDRDPLVLDLIRAKLLDRNYPLYASQFYGVTASANAVTYDFQHVQREEPDFDFVLSESEVVSVISLGGNRVFEYTGLFNRTIYDTLLPNEIGLDVNLKILATESADALEFLKAYVQQGKHPALLARRLAPFWPGIFEFAERELADNVERFKDFVIGAFMGADANSDYPVSSGVRAIIARAGTAIAPFVNQAQSPDDRVSALNRLDVLMFSFDDLSKRAVAALIAARAYEVNESTLAVVAEREDFGLDVFLERTDGTFDHLMHHFDDYLGVLDTTSHTSVTEPINIVDVLSAVERSLPMRSRDIETRIKGDLLVDDVQTAPTEVLGVLASGYRFRFTLDNVATYIEVRGVDDQLIGYLEEQRGLAVAEDTPPDRRELLATQILGAKEVTIEARNAHVARLVQRVTPSREIGTEPELVVALVKADLLADDASTFHGFSFSIDAQEALLIASAHATEFITSVGLTENLVARVLRNGDTENELKRFFADNLPTNPSWQGASVYDAIGEWILKEPQTLYSETARLMVESGASVPARVLALSYYADKAGFDLTAQYVQSFGEPYSRLLERSRSPVEIPINPDFRGVLEVLKNGDSGPVSSWDPTDSAPTKAWMRHRVEEE